MDESTCWKISHTQSFEYKIVCGSGIFEVNNDSLLEGNNNEGKNRFIVVDKKVYDLFSAEMYNYFSNKGIVAKIVPFCAGEMNKSMDNYIAILHALDAFPINRRNEPIIGIGGGTVTDIVGFVASTYRRGVPHIHVPTTLMGYVDAAIGIKTGINFNGNKNRVGTFACPQKVILDKTFFKTLETRHILNGVGEIVKLAIIKNAHLFELLEKNCKTSIASKFQDTPGAQILKIAIDSMIEELEPNLFESNLSRSADFGHTFSTVLELDPLSDILHGEAVVLDCVFSSILANQRHLLSNHEFQKIVRLIVDLGLTKHFCAVNVDLFWSAITERSYHRNGAQRLPLPCAIGQHVFIDDLKYKEVEIACHAYRNIMN